MNVSARLNVVRGGTMAGGGGVGDVEIREA